MFGTVAAGQVEVLRSLPPKAWGSPGWKGGVTEAGGSAPAVDVRPLVLVLLITEWSRAGRLKRQELLPRWQSQEW